MPDTRIEGTVPEEAGTRSSPLEGRLAALEQRANTLLANLEKERQAIETEKQERKPEDKPTTVGEVQVALDKLMQGVAAAVNGVSNSINEKIRDIGNIYATQDQAKQFAKDAVPTALQDLNAASSSPGDTLMRQPGGAGGQDSGYWGTVKPGGGGGITAEGDEVLYKGIFLREYDGDGVIVAAGSEINPADYATQELYDAALVAAGHTLKATWDYTRAHG